MTVTVRMFPAGNGDAFLVSRVGYDSFAILIDCGYRRTFRDYVYPLLKANAIADQSFALDLVIATHIDADHISGLISLFQQSQTASPQIPIRQVWHNGFRQLAASRADEQKLTRAESELLLEISRRGFCKETDSSIATEEISARQGSAMGKLIEAGDYSWNQPAGGGAIQAGLSHQIGKSVQIEVIGPTDARLAELRSWWIRELKRLGISSVTSDEASYNDVFEFLCSYEAIGNVYMREISSRQLSVGPLSEIYEPDTSVTNGSSISFVLTAENLKLLFLGDSFPEDTVSWLESTATPSVFDLIKVSHHGAYHNTSPRLLELLDAPRFLISTDGYRHNHPDLPVLRAIVDRPAEFHRDLYFSHPTSASEAMKSYVSKSNTPFSVHESCQEIEIRG